MTHSTHVLLVINRLPHLVVLLHIQGWFTVCVLWLQGQEAWLLLLVRGLGLWLEVALVDRLRCFKWRLTLIILIKLIGVFFIHRNLIRPVIWNSSVSLINHHVISTSKRVEVFLKLLFRHCPRSVLELMHLFLRVLNRHLVVDLVCLLSFCIDLLSLFRFDLWFFTDTWFFSFKLFSHETVNSIFIGKRIVRVEQWV